MTEDTSQQGINESTVLKRKTDHPEQVKAYMEQFKIPEGPARSLVARDLVVQRLFNNEQKWKKRALEDPLTELKRKELFVPHLEKRITELKKGERHAVVVAITDIDKFSLWNDLGSHELGDEGLRGLAEALSSSMREGDNTFRIGGEEFGVDLDVKEELKPEEYEELSRRVGEVFGEKVMNTMLDKVVYENLLNGKRMELTSKRDSQGNQLREKRGTIVFKSFAREVLKRATETTEDGSLLLDKALENAKGNESDKAEYRRIVTKEFNLEAYKNYLADERTYDELQYDEAKPDPNKQKAQIQRRELEEMIARDIHKLFKRATCSTGFVVLTKEDAQDIQSAAQIKDIADGLMYDSKMAGKNRVAVQMGISGRRKIYALDEKFKQPEPAVV